MYRFFEGTKKPRLYVQADGKENNLMALISCVFNVLFCTGGAEQAMDFQEKALASIESGADRKGAEKVIKEYVTLHVIDKKNPKYADLFDGLDAFYKD